MHARIDEVASYYWADYLIVENLFILMMVVKTKISPYSHCCCLLSYSFTLQLLNAYFKQEMSLVYK